MEPSNKDLELAHLHYQERLDVLKKLLSMYTQNKHRSRPNRGPYEYGLKVARKEFEMAKNALQVLISESQSQVERVPGETLPYKSASVDTSIFDLTGRLD